MQHKHVAARKRIKKTQLFPTLEIPGVAPKYYMHPEVIWEMPVCGTFRPSPLLHWVLTVPCHGGERRSPLRPLPPRGLLLKRPLSPAPEAQAGPAALPQPLRATGSHRSARGRSTWQWRIFSTQVPADGAKGWGGKEGLPKPSWSCPLRLPAPRTLPSARLADAQGAGAPAGPARLSGAGLRSTGRPGPQGRGPGTAARPRRGAAASRYSVPAELPSLLPARTRKRKGGAEAA